jgi:transcriptional regulator with XRE-family HTH domain
MPQKTLDHAVAERFGENLRRCRRRVRLSQEEVARRASLHRTEVGKLEHGRRCPRIDTLMKLMAAVEASSAELLDGMDWTPPRTGEGLFFVSRDD